MKDDTPAVGFCSLGTMGLPMAANLARAFANLHVWNRTPGRTGELDATTSTVHDTPASLAGAADRIVLMLWDTVAVDAVLFGPDGIAARRGPARW